MTHSHTAYIPIWYTPENAAKYKNTAESVSRQINFDKIQPLPRLSLVALDEEYGEYELELLSKAETYGLSVPRETSNAVDFAELEYLVGQYEALKAKGLALPRLHSQWFLDLNEYGKYELELLSKANSYGLKLPYFSTDYDDEVPNMAELEYLVCLYENLDEEGLELAEKARIYHIPIKEYHLKDIMKLRFEIEDYELLLDRAMNAHIDWDTSTYDPEGLESAVAEANWNFEQQYRDYRMSVSIAYRVGRGV